MSEEKETEQQNTEVNKKCNSKIIWIFVIILLFAGLCIFLANVSNNDGTDNLKKCKNVQISYKNGEKSVICKDGEQELAKETFDSEKQISDIQKSDVIVRKNTSLSVSGIVEGSVRVENGAKANISGIINGDVINDGKTEISGTINGNVINSGNVKIYGIVEGNVIKKGGSTYIDSNALVNGTVE